MTTTERRVLDWGALRYLFLLAAIILFAVSALLPADPHAFWKWGLACLAAALFF